MSIKQTYYCDNPECNHSTQDLDPSILNHQVVRKGWSEVTVVNHNDHGIRRTYHFCSSSCMIRGLQKHFEKVIQEEELEAQEPAPVP
jgi:hypothetical protein